MPIVKCRGWSGAAAAPVSTGYAKHVSKINVHHTLKFILLMQLLLVAVAAQPNARGYVNKTLT
jgi:hypothetical protein